ncbi:MAG: type II toxin-antitoxin system YafQ family toxin [Oscillospiraceae bacterium]|nr:type II toxin-antitoxin system YafQ family toxin [Oscillospiraceae bacterium]
MLKPKPSNAFRKDVQRIARRGKDIVKMLPPLTLLLSGEPLLEYFLDHPLKGDWFGYRQFHIEPDWVVIYRCVGEFLVLERTGTHSELFKK